MHYCMGELTELGLSHNKDKVCSNCGMKDSENNGCCKDEQQLLKIDKEQKTANVSYQLPQFTSDALIYKIYLFLFVSAFSEYNCFL